MIGLIVLTLYFHTSCSDKDASMGFGSPVSSMDFTPMAGIFDYPEKYDGKIVILTGTIDMQDEKGSWFYLQDEDARMYVDLSESGFKIPDLNKRRVLVEGTIEVKMRIPSLMASGVEPR